jgi:hypothetical protein
MIHFNSLAKILAQAGEDLAVIERIRAMYQYHSEYKKSMGGKLLPEVENALETVKRKLIQDLVSPQTFAKLYPSDTMESEQQRDFV